MKNKINKILIITLTMGAIVFGQGSRMGTASSSQLHIPQGAQFLSGGGAASNAAGIDAVYWNPAGLSRSENNVDAIFSYRTYIADITNSYFGLAGNLGSFGKAAISFRSFNIGEIKETTIFQQDGTGNVFTPQFMVVGGTISKAITDRTSIGASANWISEGFGRVSASGISFDIGVQYNTLLDIDNLDVGFVIRNFGQPVTYSGEGLGVWAEGSDTDRPEEYYKVDAASFDLPYVMDMSASYNLAGINIGGTYTSNYYATDEIRLLASYDLAGIGSVRGGYQMSTKAQEITDEVSKWDYKSPFDGVSFGGTLNIGELMGGGNFSLDYAYMPTEVFNDNQVFTLRVGF
ncbi:MAG: hypothetical protein QF380_06640 [Candidatus Marinimicrobia bacterium]|jgi:hypothetical protein|nr:hypothetical protein [Candidatus Neomarinimicrobiota bacterium]